MTKPKAYFRIGSDKAGTTSLANFIGLNREELEKRSIWAPMRNCIPWLTEVSESSNFLDVAPFHSTDYLVKRETNRQAYDAFRHRLATESPSDTLLLTTETLWGRLSRKNFSDKDLRAKAEKFLEAIKESLSGYDLYLILHLRRIDQYVESVYKQKLKAGRIDVPFDDFLSRLDTACMAANQLGFYQIMESVFGKERVILRPFEREQFFEGDLNSDLLRIIDSSGKGIANCKIPPASNESLHRAVIELLPERNREKGKTINNSGLGRMTDLLTKAGIPNSKHLMRKDDRVRVLEEFSAFYQHISENQLGGEKVFKSPLPGDVKPYDLSEDQIVEVERAFERVEKRHPFRKRTKESVQPED